MRTRLLDGATRADRLIAFGAVATIVALFVVFWGSVAFVAIHFVAKFW